MKIREATLKPKSITLRVQENHLCILYRVNVLGSDIGNVYVNFEPSNELLNLLESEIDIALKLNKNIATSNLMEGEKK